MSRTAGEPAPKRAKTEENEDYNYYTMMQEQRMCDFTVITSDGKKIPCHRLYLIRSPYFAGMLESAMIESQKNETKEDVESVLFEALLEFLYTNKVKNIEELAEKLLVVADRYCCDKLVGLCVSTLSRTMNASNAARYLASCGMIDPKFRKLAFEFICGNLEEVMSSECWRELSENFELMTELLKIVLTSKKGKSYLTIADLMPPQLSADSEMKREQVDTPEKKPDQKSKEIEQEFGLLSHFSKTVVWKILYNKVSYKRVRWSPEFNVHIGWQSTCFRACVVTCKSDSYIRIYLTCTSAVLPPPIEVTCTVIQSEAASWRTKLSWDYKENWYPKLVMPDLSGGRISMDYEDFWVENGGPVIKFEFHYDSIECSQILDTSPYMFLESALKNRRYADVTIRILDLQFPLHKLVLGEQSEVFHSLFEAHPSTQEFNLTNPDVSYKEILDKNNISSFLQSFFSQSSDGRIRCIESLWNLMYGNEYHPSLPLCLLTLKFRLHKSLGLKVDGRIVRDLHLDTDCCNACLVLAQAHVLNLKRVEKYSFTFIRNNLAAAVESPAWTTLSECPGLVASLFNSAVSLPDLTASTTAYKPEYHEAAVAYAMRPSELPCVVPAYKHKFTATAAGSSSAHAGYPSMPTGSPSTPTGSSSSAAGSSSTYAGSPSTPTGSSSSAAGSSSMAADSSSTPAGSPSTPTGSSSSAAGSSSLPADSSSTPAGSPPTPTGSSSTTNSSTSAAGNSRATGSTSVDANNHSTCVGIHGKCKACRKQYFF